MMDGKNKLVVGALVLSVAANLLAAGVWIGREFSPGKHERFSGPPKMDFSLREMGQYLPDEKRDEVRALMKEHRKVLAKNFMAMREVEREIRTLMTAEVVDRAALVNALDRHEAAMDQLHMPVRQILLDVVATLDHDTRVKLAENMFRRRLIMGPRDGGPDGRRERGFEFRDDRRPPPGEDGFDGPPPRPEDEDGPDDDGTEGPSGLF